VYDMYPWSKHADPGQSGRPPAPSAPTRAIQATRTPQAVQAVQVALDRRDNGGDAAAEPTASRARQ
jgi:hypothetical protein